MTTADFFALPNGVKMPAVGFGTWEITPDSRAEEIVGAALDTGYRHIDTATLYGNETGVGRAVRASGIPRGDIFVTTKLWNLDHAYKDAMRAVDASLARLGLDYVDLYLIHWPGPGSQRETWHAMQDIYAGGKAKAIGVSNFTVAHLEELLSAAGTSPMVNQIEFYPYIYDEQRDLLDYCKQHNIAVEAYSPLRHSLAADPAIEKVAARVNQSPSQVILRWCLQYGTAPLPRSQNPAHIRENLEIFDFELSGADMTMLDRLSA